MIGEMDSEKLARNQALLDDMHKAAGADYVSVRWRPDMPLDEREDEGPGEWIPVRGCRLCGRREADSHISGILLG